MFIVSGWTTFMERDKSLRKKKRKLKIPSQSLSPREIRELKKSIQSLNRIMTPVNLRSTSKQSFNNIR